MFKRQGFPKNKPSVSRVEERRMIKISNYQQNETQKLVTELTKLSQGNTDVVIELAPCDADTQTTYETFLLIGASVSQCVASIKALVQDVGMLAQAGIAGNLDTRADISKHQGDYDIIKDNMNQTVDFLKRYRVQAKKKQFSNQ